jgi:putative transposase
LTWYNDAHHHSGIAMLTPAQVHHGYGLEVLEQRQRALNASYAARPDRFVNGPPQVAALPNAVWINPPQDKTENVISLH